MTPISILDLAPIVEGGSAAQAFRNSLDLAQHAERLGLSPLLARGAPQHARGGQRGDVGRHRARRRPARRPSGSAPAGSCCRIIRRSSSRSSSARSKRSSRAGSISGVGRAPGSDQVTALALRRNPSIDSFPQDVQELMALLREPAPGQRVRAVPGRRARRCRSGSSDRACSARSSPPSSACRSRSPRTSRRRR